MVFLSIGIPVVLLNLFANGLSANHQITTVLLSTIRVSQFVLVTVDLLLFAQLLLKATVDLLHRT